MNSTIGLFAMVVAAVVSTAFSPRRKLLNLRGKVVLITGGSRGLGLATAYEFASRGSIVAICARDGEELELSGQISSGWSIRERPHIEDGADERSQISAAPAEIRSRGEN